jgi:hypothetical protein
MLPWIKRWRGLAMADFWPMHRISPQPQALHYSYEKAGLTLHDQPIPWNAEVVVVEALLRLKPALPRRKGDFQMHVPGQPPVVAENLRRQEGDDLYRLFFRLPLPPRSVPAELFWCNHRLGQITLPVLEQEEFIQQLRLQMPTLFVRLGDQSVACQTFVSTQCRGLMASAILTSPTSLVPILDLGLQVEFRSERGGVHTVPVQLSSSQLAERQALLAVVPRRFPRRMGTWTATWMLGDHPLATQRVRAISQRHFQRSLRVSDTRFLVQTVKGKVSLARQLPPLDELAGAGPCFLVSSREPGMAGLCALQVKVQAAGAKGSGTPLFEQEILITDGPTAVAPGVLSAGEMGGITAFELRLKSNVLGVLPTTPIPAANFTGEGGFKPLQDFPWSVAADEELNDRLGRLLEERGSK